MSIKQLAGYAINFARYTVLAIWQRHRVTTRLIALMGVLLLLFYILSQVIESSTLVEAYKIPDSVQRLLPKSIDQYASKIKLEKQGNLEYNKDYSGIGEVGGDSSFPRITATFGGGSDKSVTIKDPVAQQTVTFTPRFAISSPRQDHNRVVYKINKYNALKIYSLGSTTVKEDIVLLEKPKQDQIEFDYELQLGNSQEAKLESDGSVAVYTIDSALAANNIATATTEDAELLQKAQQNAPKNRLVFRIPAPVVLEDYKKVSDSAKAKFDLDGKHLKLTTQGLNNAKYPLSIDPTVYVETARKLMRGNNETNVDFDVANELIQKSQTTGARIDAWSSTTNLTSAVYGQGTAVAGGYIYSVGGIGSGATNSTTYNIAGSSTYVVPAGVTSVTVKAWGAGGGGGAGSGSSGKGGAGGGGGYAKSVISVTPAESLTVEVGTGGAKATANSRAGNGGGYSAVKRSTTFLVQAGGGGGGGGHRGNSSGAGGAGGPGYNGTDVGTIGNGGNGNNAAGGGARGTTSAGGVAGAAGTGGAAGVAGAANAGGNGSATATSCTTATTGTGGNGGTGAGGSGGTYTAANCSNGGGGGGGRFGGGGGGTTSSNNSGGGGGGGGSSLTTGTSNVETSGSGATPGNSSDGDRGGLGDGGTGATTFGAATAGDNGIVVISYTTAGSVSNSVYWAQFNASTNAIEAPNPGDGACAGWCNNSVYNLPTALTGLSLVTYNGFLYAIGGENSGGTPQTTVYIAKLGANGEPQKWHPTGGTNDYWYTDTSLSNARSKFAAVAYNNRMYIMGGLTTSSTVLSSNTVQYADIKPNGTLTTWTSTGMSALSTARYGLTAQVYNNTIYLLGGDATLSGSPVTTVEYVKLKSDGTMNSWVATSSLINGGRLTVGGSFSTIYGAYVYVTGGCTAVNASGYCTAIASDVQLASINADGSLAEFNTVIGLSNDRFAHTLIGWQGGLYRLGGCRAQDGTSGGCTNTALDVDYGVINPAGEASTVATSTDNTQSPCSLASPYNCSLPSASVGNMLNVTAVVNGYLYVMGGCTNDACTTYSTGVTYQAVGSDGSLQKPASCTGTYTDSYCVSSASLPTAISAAGVTVFNNRIYVVGGFPSISNIYYVSVNSDGSLGAWQNNDTNTGTTTAADAVSYTYSYARANPASAGSNPGNLYIIGGCSGTITGIGCSGYSQSVYKCNITTSGTVTSCSTASQQQIGTVTGNDGNPAGGTGLGAFGAAVYANYIYLLGGLAPGTNGTDLKYVRYAKFDDSNNIVAVSGSAWIEGANQMNTGRRRGAGFGYNGYLYVLGGYDGTDAIADIEFAKINVTDGSWGVFDTSSVTIQKRWALSTVVSNSYAYVVGGCIAGPAPAGCTNRTNTVQTFQIYNNDSGAVKSVSALSDDTFAADTNRIGASAAVVNGFVYVAGGCTNIACGSGQLTRDVQYSKIDTSDGTLGTWATASNILPTNEERAWGKLLVLGDTTKSLYYVGGQDDTTDEKPDIYYVSSFNTSTGDITAAWAAASGGIGDTNSQVAQDRTKFGAAAWNNRMYIVAGLNDSAAVTNTVYISPQLNSGGNIAADSWSSDANVPDVARSGGAVTAYANNLYLFGGNDGTNYLNDSQFTQINSDGSVDAWVFTTSLPGYFSDAESYSANGYIYLTAGRSAVNSCSPKTLMSPVSANTTVASGNNPTGVGEWFETNVRYGGGRYGAAVAYEKGKVYTMGGGCSAPQAGSYNTGTITQSGTTVTGSGGANWNDDYRGATITYQDASTATVVSINSSSSITVSVSKTIASAQTYTISTPRHTYSVLKSQPQVAIYSRMIDTDTDVFPTAWLLNGIDNSIGARWQAKYRSMHDISDGAGQQNPTEDCGTSVTMPLMTTWGQETDFGSVALGNVENYTALNGSGGNINCARYFYFIVSIDASKTFGYPEDVQRGPTINDLSLFFTSDPSKRLRGGKTFTGGEQQPFDAPCRKGSAVPGDPNYNCPLP